MELITPPTPEEVNEVINNHHAEQEEEEEEVLQQPIIEIHEPSWVIDLPQQPSTDISDSSDGHPVIEAYDSDQMSIIARKCVSEQHERRVQELTRDCEQAKNECHEAWMCLRDSTRQLEELRNDHHFKSLQVNSLEGRVTEFTELQEKLEKDKKLWVSSMQDLNAKIQALRGDYHKLSEEARSNSFPDISDITSAMQSLGVQYEDLKKKYIEESKERKQLYNELLELKGNIRVFCRCRPLSAEEIAVGACSIVEFDKSKDNELAININGASKKNFKFDRVFTPEDNQEDVFLDTAPVVVSVLDGYNVCIFAYGQTGTGKTFTMEGTPENRGVNFRTLEELFRVAEERKGQYNYNISVSVLEVYNEQIRDLLASPAQQGQHAKKLDIKQVAEGVQHVPGLVEAKVQNMNEVWEVLQTGSAARAVGSTNANELSSRSHCILSVMVMAKSLVNGQFTTSKLWLVDLAGSERIAKTDVHGERLKEAQYINKSLSALGDVIASLTTKSSHIPYRNSKLTHLLQDSLGGDSKTLMFVQISPHENDMGETLCSLNFASRVRGLELGPTRRQQDAGEVFKYKQMIERIRQDGKEVKKMEESLQNMEIKFKGREQMCRNLQEKIKELEAQLAKERKARAVCETKLRDHQRHSEKLPEKKAPLFRQSNSSRSVRRTPLSKDLTNLPKQVLTLDRNTKQQDGRSFMKMDMIESFASGTPLNKENEGKSTVIERKKGRFSMCALPPRSSVLPSARRISMIPAPPLRSAIFKTEAAVDHSGRNERIARRTSMSTLSRRTSSIPMPRRTSMAVIPMRRNEVSTSELQLPAHQFALSPAEKCGKNNIPYHDSGAPHTSTPVSLRGVKISHALDRFRGTIHSKVRLNSPLLKASNALQEINQKQENHKTNTDDNFTVASSLSLDQKPQPNEINRLRHLSNMRTWGSHSAAGARAQRVLCGNKTSSRSIMEDRENETRSGQLDSGDILSNR